jgi:phosphoglucosamine mutase
VRGVANAELAPELVVALGRAAATVFGASRFAVGRDTRVSGPMLQAALVAGLSSHGADVDDLGVLPTPGVAWVSATEDIPAAVISASHNPFPDNGIKFFGAGGRKLDDAVEERLEAELDRLIAGGTPIALPTGRGIGRIRSRPAAPAYVDALVASLDGRRFPGLRVVLDCAHGAAWQVAPHVFEAAGARVDVVANDPDGVNINDGCGSTHPEVLRRAVVELGADIGLAFDGDADRVLAVDADGNLVDGDQIIAICAIDRRQRGLLPEETIVVTVMANLGLRHAMSEQGIKLVETPVGDRFVLAELESAGLNLGGEQSGHIVFRDLATTGDGILTGLQVLDVVARSGRPLGELASVMRRLPQVLRNVAVQRGATLEGASGVWSEVEAVERELGDDGRVLLRPSGTEPLVRVMVEAPTEQLAEAAADRLVAAVERSLT